MNQSLRLYQLNEYIRRVIALNFSESIWINCEIASYRESRGHAYLELIENSEFNNEIIAQASAAIWRTQLLNISKKLGSEKESVLQAGKEILIKIRVEFNEKFGLKLIVEEIDLSFTLGKLALRRQEILMELTRLQLLNKNSSLNLPIVLQKIAVISSENAAGWQDFKNQLADNIFGYHCKVTLFNSAMQGQNVENEVVEKLQSIKKSKNLFDCVVIIRGGGGKVDLSDFDNLLIAKTIAEMPIPVLTGIGHDIDQSITDMVAHTSLKTPTAVAEFIIQHNMNFESNIIQLGRLISDHVLVNIQKQKEAIDYAKLALNWAASTAVSNAHNKLDLIYKQIPIMVSSQIQLNNSKLDNISNLLEQLSPEAHFNRGYSIVEFNGLKISKKNKPKIGEEIEIFSVIGKTSANVTKLS
ncbi:MAG: exodeoxyribonuclease VII large subunit [Saprospiraceae bacterium]|nr:exodeoxyribonuclease VII large subunit [Saprospiraceae bacterium]